MRKIRPELAIGVVLGAVVLALAVAGWASGGVIVLAHAGPLRLRYHQGGFVLARYAPIRAYATGSIAIIPAWEAVAVLPWWLAAILVGISAAGITWFVRRLGRTKPT